jgi:ankyrin repeat protein
MGKCWDAKRKFEEAMKASGAGAAFRSGTQTDHNRGPCKEADDQALRIIDELYINNNADFASYGWTPLDWAVEKGHEALVRHLLDKDAGSNADWRKPL